MRPGRFGNLEFADFYDTAFFREVWRTQVGVLVGQPETGNTPDNFYLVPVTNPILELSKLNYTHVTVECPAFKVRFDRLFGASMWLALTTAFKPATGPSQIIAQIQKSIGGLYNFLHFRIEEDWQHHCSRWEHIQDGKMRPNCLKNSNNIKHIITNAGFSTSIPLYVACFWQDVNVTLAEVLLNGLRESGYRVITSKYTPLCREQAAHIDFEIGLRSFMFMGNSVSSFSALAIFERRLAGKWSSYYNSADIPLEEFLPVYDIPWVSDCSWDFNRTTTVGLLPICLFTAENEKRLRRLNAVIYLEKKSHVDPIQQLAESLNVIYHEISQYNYILYSVSDVSPPPKFQLHTFVHMMTSEKAVINILFGGQDAYLIRASYLQLHPRIHI